MQSSGYQFITPSSTCLSEDLLFFDTFSHSGQEKDNFDLVQFPSPVVIDLIKIVPLGQPIEAKIPGNVRLGATNPSNCELEFFINDLTKQDAHTMTDLGKFYCNEKETDFNPPLQIQTDGLLLRGSYRTLTLAIFGQIATYDEKIEDEPVILSAASPPAQTPASPVASERDIPYIVRSVDQEIIRRTGDESESFDESTLKSGELIKDGSLVDNVDMIEDAMLEVAAEPDAVKERVPAVLEEMDSSEGGPSTGFTPKDKKNEELEHSNSTELETNYKHYKKNDSLKHPPATDNEELEDEDAHTDHEIKEWFFNVDNYPLKPLIYFADPSLTLQERTISLQKTELLAFPSHKESVDKEIEKVKEMFDALNCTDQLKTEDWVTLVEDLTNDLSNMSLSHTVSDDDMLNFLITQVCHGLDMNLALRQKQTGFKVRHLRAGIKLANILFHCGDTAVSALLEASIPEKVLRLYNEDQMSLPLRLLIFKCLNTACDTVQGVEHIIHHECTWNNTTINTIKMRINERNQLKKTGAIEREEPAIKDEAPDDESNQFPSPGRNPIDKRPVIENESENKPLSCYQYIVLILLSQPTTRVTIAIGNLIKKIRLYQDFHKLAELNSDDSKESEDNVFHRGRISQRSEKYIEQSLIIIQDVVNLIKDGCSNVTQPTRYLPAKVQFQIKPSPSDIYLSVYKWLKHFCTLECFNTLLSIPQTDSTSTTEIEQSIRLQSLCQLFIQQILDAPRGTQFLLSAFCYEASGNIIRSLAEKQAPKRSSHVRMSDGIENCLSASLCREESLSAASCNDMSLRMSYNFKVFSCIDKLFHFHRELISKRGDSSLSDPEKILHQLYIMSDHPYGLAAILKHFSSIGNLDCLLRFLDMPEYHKQLEFVKETSIDYALELVGTFLRLNNSVLEIADEYLDTLVDLCKTKDKTLAVRIKSLLPWLSPFEAEQPFPLITYSEDTFRQLTRVIRKSIPNYSIPFAKGLNFELPPQMITAVRILRQLCIPPQVESFIEATFDVFSTQKFTAIHSRSPSFMSFVDSLPHQQNQNQSWNLNIQLSRNNGANSLSEDSISDQLGQISNTFKLFQPYDESICGELKYHYGIMQVFEQEGLKRLLNTLRELIGNYPRPVYQSAALSGFRGRIVISYIHSVIILLHSITCHLIDSRASEFKDTSIIPVILETYSLLCFVPKPDQSKKRKEMLNKQCDLTSLQKSLTLQVDNYQSAQQTKKLILSILMSYTQMCLSVSESEEKVISKSMWTKMLKEVIEFTLSTPIFFHHGLDILTKILPSPLPCSSIMDSIDQEQLFKNINHRKLWSAHLHPLHQQIEQMISYLSICYQSNIRTLLYYLCNQLCDLSSNAACMVAKIITDTLIVYASRLSFDANGNNTSPDQQQHGPSIQPQQSSSEDKLACGNVFTGTKESAYAVKMILNLLSNLITNQAFETAFTNHLQVIGKKDERLLANLQNTLKLHEDYRPGELVEDNLNAGSSTCSASVAHLIESIKAMNENSTKDNYTNNPFGDVAPPEELTKINLLEVARKASDRSFSLQTGLKKTYRLKVLLDLNSRAHRSSEPSSKKFDHSPYNYQELSVSSSHKAYVAPLRGRGRPAARPDVFRSRAQNTSRPPSIHVDDFIDLYGDNSAQSSSSRYPGTSKSSVVDYRGSSSSRGYPDQMSVLHNEPPISHRHSFFSQQQPPISSGSPYSSGSGNSRAQHVKAKYMKLK